MTAAESRRKSAALLVAFILVAVAIILTIGSLPDGGRPEPSDVVDEVLADEADRSPNDWRGDGGTDRSSDASENAAAGDDTVGRIRCVLDDADEAECRRSFAIDGDAVGLYPGASVRLPLTLENPNGEDLRVTTITLTVSRTSIASCDTSNIQTSGYSGPSLVVPAQGSRSVTLSLTMSRSAPDACQGATFTLAYFGEAEAA